MTFKSYESTVRIYTPFSIVMLLINSCNIKLDTGDY